VVVVVVVVVVVWDREAEEEEEEQRRLTGLLSVAVLFYRARCRPTAIPIPTTAHVRCCDEAARVCDA
jgi:hypothetical protein